MAEYKPFVQPFENKGVIQKIDPAILPDGAYQRLINVTSVQEGALASRFGSTRFSTTIPGTNAHTIGILRLGAADADQYFYIGEGADIYRIRKSAPNTVTQMTNVSLPSWGQRWTSNTYRAGSSGRPWFFVAASRMLKDDLSSTAFQQWGILPPPNAPTAAVTTQYSKTIDNGDDPDHTWGADGFEIVSITSDSDDLSAFDTPSAAPSGKASNFWESEDYIELTMQLSDYSKFTQYLLQFDCNDGTYADYYEKTILPYGYAEAVSGDPAVRGIPANLPPSSGGTDEIVTVLLKKNTFLKVGAAGTNSGSEKSWKTITDVRLYAKSATGAVLTVTSLKLVGGSGPDNTVSGGQPYEYAYTYRNDTTAFESNPSVPQITENYLRSVSRQPVTISNLVYSTDAQVTRLAIYRRGGTFTDGLFRLIGYVDNNSGGGTTTFTDTLLDSDIVFASTMENDNDPPVTSTLPTALSATFTGAGASGLQTVTLSQSVANILTPGTMLTVLDNDRTERIRVKTVSGSDISAYFQNIHSGTIRVVCESVVGVPCALSVIAGDSVYLAGDQNNPHVLYKSKTGRPEAFPVITEATGNANQIIVGSHSNPIKALTEYGGDVVCMNLRGFYIVRTIGGQMQPAQETPCSHGLLGSFAWCKADGELFFLSNDGVYSWWGGREEKRSEEIDWFFKGQTVNGIKPFDMTDNGLRWTRMEHFRNEVWLIGFDTDGNAIAAVYDTQYKRWSFRTPSKEGGASAWWSSILATNEGLFTCKNLAGNTYLYQENAGYADNNQAFSCVIQTGFYTFGQPTLQKQIGDIVLELTSTQTVTIKTYYDFSSSADETLTITGASGRRRIPLPIQSGAAKECYAIGFQFEFDSVSTGAVVLHSLTFNVLELADIQRGRPTDWSDYGWPHDKRLDQLIIEYDTGNTSVTLNLDTIAGIAGNVASSAVATFTLTGAGRAQATLPIKAATGGGMVVAKKMRLRPTAASANFKIFNATITYEKYPPDITYFTDPSDYGSPFDKHFQQLLLDIDTGGVDCSVQVFIDGAVTASQTLTVNSTATTRQQTLTLNTGLTGKKARLVFQPGANGKAQLFSHDFVHVPADKGPVVHTTDWMDLGHAFDKRLYQLHLEYEVASDVSYIVEGISGIGAAQTSATITTLTLKSSTRRRHSFPMPDGTVVKLVRVRPSNNTPAATAKIYQCDFEKENYPPDVVAYTPSDNYGTPYIKYFNQLVLDVDTGGVAASVAVEVDGSTVQTISVSTTAATRNQSYTLNPGIVGRRARILATAGSGGKFQLFHHTFIVTPADQGAVRHSFDWDDLGWPHDKRLTAVTFKYDNMSAGSVTMNMDTLSGISGTTITSTAAQFTLSGTTRGEQTFPIADGTIVKAVRIYPAAANTSFKMWTYHFEFEKYPADKVIATPWDTLAHPCEKVLRNLTLEIDTGNVACTVELQADGVTKQTYTVTTTANDRVRTLSCDSDIADTYIIGREFRLKFTAGANGKAQYFSHTFEKVYEPCPAWHWDSFEQTFGSAGYRYIKECWVNYRGGSCTFKVYRDDGTLLYTKNLPAHTNRTTERFYLPAVNGTVLNKSKGHRIVIDAVDPTKPFYLYRDSSRIAVGFLSAGARAGYGQSYLFSDMPLGR